MRKVIGAAIVITLWAYAMADAKRKFGQLVDPITFTELRFWSVPKL